MKKILVLLILVSSYFLQAQQQNNTKQLVVNSCKSNTRDRVVVSSPQLVDMIGVKQLIILPQEVITSVKTSKSSTGVETLELTSVLKTENSLKELKTYKGGGCHSMMSGGCTQVGYGCLVLLPTRQDANYNVTITANGDKAFKLVQVINSNSP
ncbi:MAG: hypothetical protein ACOVO1_10270 [Chitinophagaceae bacterium]